MAVNDRIRKATHDGQLDVVRAHYQATKADAQQAKRDAVDFASLGYELAERSDAPGHLNVGRSALGVAAALGVARVVGIGLFRTSHSSGEVVLTYRKARASEAQRPKAAYVRAAVIRTGQTVATESIRPTIRQILSSPLSSEQTRRNVAGRELERVGHVDQGIALYETSPLDAQGASFAFNRLSIIYHKRGQYDDEIRAIEAQAQNQAPGVPMPEHLARRLAKAQQLRTRAAGSAQS